MARNEVARMAENQRWSSKRKAEILLEIIKVKLTTVDYCRAVFGRFANGRDKGVGIEVKIRDAIQFPQRVSM